MENLKNNTCSCIHERGNQENLGFLATENSITMFNKNFKIMTKKMFFAISTFIMFVFVAVMMSSCEKHDEVKQSVGNNSEYVHLYNTDYLKTGVNSLKLSVEDLKQIHNSIASIYQVRSELQKDWSKRNQYVLNSKIFVNEYLQKEMTMYLYECVRFLSPNEEQYVKNLPYIENIIINVDEIFEKDDLLLVPLRVDSRDYWDDKYLEKDIYEQFFVLKKIKNQFVIVNFISGYLSDKHNEIFSKIFEYTQENWGESSYNRESNTLKTRSSDYDMNNYLDFIEGDMQKEEYIKKMKQNNVSMKSSRSSNYNRIAAVKYALKWTDYSGNCSSNSYNPEYNAFSLDCANFVSQCLKEGGFTNDYYGSSSCLNWYYNNGNSYSNTWSTANGLKRYLYDCGGYTTVVSTEDLWNGNNIEKGDPFFIASVPAQGEGPYYHHSVIITEVKNGWDVRYSAHCNNRKNRTMHHSSTPYDFWFNQKWTRGFHINQVNNWFKLV